MLHPIPTASWMSAHRGDALLFGLAWYLACFHVCQALQTCLSISQTHCSCPPDRAPSPNLALMPDPTRPSPRRHPDRSLLCTPSYPAAPARPSLPRALPLMSATSPSPSPHLSLFPARPTLSLRLPLSPVLPTPSSCSAAACRRRAPPPAPCRPRTACRCPGTSGRTGCRPGQRSAGWEETCFVTNCCRHCSVSCYSHGCLAPGACLHLADG